MANLKYKEIIFDSNFTQETEYRNEPLLRKIYADDYAYVQPRDVPAFTIPIQPQWKKIKVLEVIFKNFMQNHSDMLSNNRFVNGAYDPIRYNADVPPNLPHTLSVVKAGRPTLYFRMRGDYYFDGVYHNAKEFATEYTNQLNTLAWGGWTKPTTLVTFDSKLGKLKWSFTGGDVPDSLVVGPHSINYTYFPTGESSRRLLGFGNSNTLTTTGSLTISPTLSQASFDKLELQSNYIPPDSGENSTFDQGGEYTKTVVTIPINANFGDKIYFRNGVNNRWVNFTTFGKPLVDFKFISGPYEMSLHGAGFAIKLGILYE